MDHPLSTEALQRTYTNFHAWAPTSNAIAPIDLKNRNCVSIDLTASGDVLRNSQRYKDEQAFSHDIYRYLTGRSADIGVGGYAEDRPIYASSDFTDYTKQGVRHRRIHLGLDFWLRRAGEPVYCPLPATVIRQGVDSTVHGYGHYLILGHTPLPHLQFFTLYGHLAKPRRVLMAGTRVQRGEQVATLGATHDNGNWPVHLHFQCILDLLNYAADFPGVAYIEEKDYWLGICPDPQLLLVQALS